MSSTSPMYYVYGIVGGSANLEGAPAGIGGARVEAVEGDGLQALVSVIDADEYRAELIEERAGDVEWLAPRAEAHDAVVSWAGEPGPVVPLHMWTLFSDRQSIRAMLTARSAGLHGVLERLSGADEYGLRVYADAAALERAATSGDEALTQLEREAASAGPGQRYLIERKLATARRDSARAQARSTADSIFDQLAKKSVDAARDEIPGRVSGEAAAVLSAAFLVKRSDLDEFRAAVTDLVRKHEPSGFRFAFTGPWPPYHFAAGGGA